MNNISYIIHYLIAFAHVRFEENYWDQVFMNDLWVAMLNAYIKEETDE